MEGRANRRFSPCGTFGGASRALTKAFHAWGGRTKWFWSARSISACVHVESTMYSVRLALRRAAPALMRLAWRVVARIWNRSDLADSSRVVCGISSPSLLYAYCTHAERQIGRASIIRVGHENANGREGYIAATTRQPLFQ